MSTGYTVFDWTLIVRVALQQQMPSLNQRPFNQRPTVQRSACEVPDASPHLQRMGSPNGPKGW